MSLTFLSDNYAREAKYSLVDPLNENKQFPLSNLKSDFTTKHFRSVNGTAQIIVDLLGTRTVDSFAVIGNSLTGLGFTRIELRGSGSMDFSNSSVISPKISHEHNMGHIFFQAQSFRFWRIDLVGTGTFAELSNVFLGERTSFLNNGFEQNSLSFREKDNAKIKKNDFGQKFINTFNRIKEMSGSIKFANMEEFDQLNLIYSLHGKHIPVWVILDPDGVSAVGSEFLFSGYFHFKSVPKASSVGFGLYDLKVDLEEAI